MKTQEVLILVNTYSLMYRALDLEKFEVGERYYLFPTEEDKFDFSWPKKWQFCGNSGIYLFIDQNDEVIYIGETTHYGNRFGSYFGNGIKKECSLKHNWNNQPFCVLPIKVPEESSFERLALEEYLIKKCRPIENTKFNY